MKKDFSIASQISLRIFLLFLAFLVGGSLFIGISIGGFVEKETKGTAGTFSKIFQRTLKEFMIAGDAEIVRRWIEGEKKMTGMEIEVYRRNGEIAFIDNKTVKQVNDYLGQDYFPLKPEAKNETTPSADLLTDIKTIVETGEPIYHREVRNDKEVFVYLAPIERDDRCLGCHGYETDKIRGVSKIVLPFSLINVEDIKRLHKLNVVIGIGAVLLMVLLFWWLLKRGIEKPVLQLGNAARQYGEGRLGGKIPQVFGSEFSPLISEFNSMSEQLYVLYSNLEDQVKERTDSFEKANEVLLQKEQEIKEDMERAMAVQMDLLPPPEAVHPGLSISSIFIPCSTLSGDFLGHFSLGNGKYAYYIIDVSGHGISASLTTVLVNGLINMKINEYLTNPSNDALCLAPGAFLGYLSNEMLQKLGRTHYATMYYGIVDTVKKTITYSGAAHPAFFHWSATTKEVSSYESQGTILGFYEDEEYPEDTISYREGDKFLFFTDGVFEVEGKNKEMFNLSQLRDAFGTKCPDRSGWVMITDLYRVVIEFSESGILNDDSVFMLLETTGKSDNSPA